jgi:NAD(P) transhydrogenase subunit alpha
VSQPTGSPADTPRPGGRLAVAALRERAPGERRVSLVPTAAAKLAPRGIDLLVEQGAGAGAWISDAEYSAAGATVLPEEQLLERADVLVTVSSPGKDLLGRLRKGQTLVGMLHPLANPRLAQELAGCGVTAISLDTLPRTLSRAQAMDALTSQANVAGYKAALIAADSFGRFFPLLITAAGTAKPAEVLVLGAGVAGLQAMGTARRLGAVVSGYDVRPETRTEIESVGARWLELRSVGPAAGEGGYARALSAEEQAAQQLELDELVTRFDVVITTAQVPGRPPPRLVTERAVGRMRPGSVLVDLGSSELGGNVEGSSPGKTVVTPGGVTIVGAGNLPSELPQAASAAFSSNVTALLVDMVSDGTLSIDLDDEVHAGVVVTHGGEVVHEAVRRLLDTSAAS